MGGTVGHDARQPSRETVVEAGRGHRRAGDPHGVGGELAGPFGRADHRGGRPVADRADLIEPQRVADQRGAQDVFQGELLAEPGVVVVLGDLVGLDRHLGQLGPRWCPARPCAGGQQGPERGAGHTNAALAQVLGVGLFLHTRGLDEALGHLLAADHQHHVVEPTGHHRVPHVEGVPPSGAARGHVEHGDARRAHVLDDVVAVEPPTLASREPRAGGGNRLDVAPGHAGVGQSGLHGGATQVGDGPVGELAPGVHAHPHDGDVSHGTSLWLWNIQLTGAVPSSSWYRVPNTNSTKSPTARLAGSSVAMRPTTRKPSSRSTTPRA